VNAHGQAISVNVSASTTSSMDSITFDVTVVEPLLDVKLNAYFPNLGTNPYNFSIQASLLYNASSPLSAFNLQPSFASFGNATFSVLDNVTASASTLNPNTTLDFAVGFNLSSLREGEFVCGTVETTYQGLSGLRTYTVNETVCMEKALGMIASEELEYAWTLGAVLLGILCGIIFFFCSRRCLGRSLRWWSKKRERHASQQKDTPVLHVVHLPQSVQGSLLTLKDDDLQRVRSLIISVLDSQFALGRAERLQVRLRQ
jgi:hypothetical protein